MILRIFAAFNASLVFITSVSAVDVLVHTAAGQPYSVATVEIPLDPPVVGPELPPIQVTSESGRVLYSIGHDVRVKVERPSGRPGRGRLIGRVGDLIREIAIDKDQLQTTSRRVSFLIRGAEPVNVTLAEGNRAFGTYRIVPEPNVDRDALLSQWWTAYTDSVHRQIQSAKYPTFVESYLVAMLSGRVNMPLPQWYVDIDQQEDELLSTLKLIAGAGGVADAMFRRSAIGDIQLRDPANLPLPQPPRWLSSSVNAGDNEVEIEPLATHVPPECYYIRYGSFDNYLWFKDLSQEHGGDISRMVTVGGIKNDSAERIETQLNLETNGLSRIFGGSVIADQAIIGRDMFMTDGASVGILTQAKNAFLLRTALNNDRASRASSDDAISLKQLKIGGRPVSFLSSADNRVRSFLAEDGDFFLVTNSRTLVERFFEISKNGKSLAATPSFRLSRTLMPLDRNDALFAYFSPEMLRGLIAPDYLIELRRRLVAKSDITLVHLARMAAKVESFEATSIDELIDAGFLPQGFNERSDGSGVVAVGDQVIDTLRGGRGTFLPIADVNIESASASERAWYEGIAADYNLRFPTIDPIMVGVQRQKVPDAPQIERIVLHAQVAPWDPSKYGWIAKQLGPPTNVAMQFAPDDIVAVQAHVASDQLGPPTHLFAAIKDTMPPKPEEFEGILNIYRSLRGIPGYLGAWPSPGALDRLPLGIGRGQPVGPGLNRLIGGLYRYNDGGFSVLSFQPDILQKSLSFMAAVDVEDQAQARARVGNLSGSQIERWVNQQLYQRAAQGSTSGASYLNMLTHQLRVSPNDVPSVSRSILGTDLQCTLGGKYVYADRDDSWVSTQWQGSFAGQDAPPQFVAPALRWFRGADATVTQYPDRVVADAAIHIRREAPGTAAAKTAAAQTAVAKGQR